MSVEDKRYGLPRIGHLRSVPAAIKFLSIEPLLEDLGKFDISGVDWVIVGGESGQGARAMEQEWVENILKSCRRQRIAFFFKQWGGVHKSTTGRLLRGRTYDQMPPLTANPIPERKTRTFMAIKWQKGEALSPPEPHAPLMLLQSPGGGH